MKTANPTLRPELYEGAIPFPSEERMTLEGALNKTLILLFIAALSAGWSWTHPQSSGSWMMIGGLLGFVAAMVTSFKPALATYTAPCYALFEGLFLGAISAAFETVYPGISFMAMTLTFATLGGMLFLYKSRLIEVTDRFKMGLFAATGAIAVVYLLAMVLSWFGIAIPYIFGNGVVGIGFSLLVVGIAAFNLLLDFDLIERGARSGAPLYMEWYSAFALMVTLVWLYVEIIRLLAKLRSRD